MIRAAIFAIAASGLHVMGSFPPPAAERRSLKTLPTRADHTNAELHAYWTGIRQLRDQAAEPDGLASFPLEDAFKAMNVNDTGVPEAYAGLWWWENHPTLGNALFTLYGGEHPFAGNEGVDQPESGFTYLSLEKPGAFAVVNNSANASNLAWPVTGFAHNFARFLLFGASKLW